jgi:hypothetical protein
MDFDYALKIGALVLVAAGGLILAYRCARWIYMVASKGSTPPQPRHREPVQDAPETTVADSDMDRARRVWGDKLERTG